jgi:fatty acid desaturase
LGHAGLIAVTAALIHWAYRQWPAWLIPVLLAHGVVLVALFAPLHEASHRTVFYRRWPNRLLAWIAGLVLLLPPTWFRHYHLAHHRYTQDPERDPELAEPKPRTLGQYLWVISGIPFWRGAVSNLFRLALGQTAGMDYLPARERRTAVREARLFIGLYGALAVIGFALPTSAPLWYWLFPVLLGQPFLRLFLLAEHTGCSQTPDGFTNTRTTLTSAPVRFLTWNMSYHAEHHLYPAVPFHALADLHRDIKAYLRVVAPGYPAAHRDIRNGLRRRLN